MEGLELGRGEKGGMPKSRESSIEGKSIGEIAEMLEGKEISEKELGEIAIDNSESRAKIRSAMEIYIARHRGDPETESIKRSIEEITVVDFLESLK
ncbi:MAG: hypothetical protein ACP5RF_04040 [Candidatus Micrarchaeia archaeon]